MNAIEFYSFRVPELRECFTGKRSKLLIKQTKNELARHSELVVELNLEIMAKYDVNDFKVVKIWN